MFVYIGEVNSVTVRWQHTLKFQATSYPLEWLLKKKKKQKISSIGQKTTCVGQIVLGLAPCWGYKWVQPLWKMIQ